MLKKILNSSTNNTSNYASVKFYANSHSLILLSSNSSNKPTPIYLFLFNLIPLFNLPPPAATIAAAKLV